MRGPWLRPCAIERLVRDDRLSPQPGTRTNPLPPGKVIRPKRSAGRPGEGNKNQIRNGKLEIRKKPGATGRAKRHPCGACLLSTAANRRSRGARHPTGNFSKIRHSRRRMSTLVTLLKPLEGVAMPPAATSTKDHNSRFVTWIRFGFAASHEPLQHPPPLRHRVRSGGTTSLGTGRGLPRLKRVVQQARSCRTHRPFGCGFSLAGAFLHLILTNS